MKFIIIAIVVAVVIYLIYTKMMKEKFSSSGMSLSDEECKKLAEVYNRPDIEGQTCRDNYEKRICGKDRKGMIDRETGNYHRDGDEGF